MLSTVLAGIAVLIALASALYTRSQAREARRSRELAEQERHDRLTPHFDLTLKPLNPGPGEEQVMQLEVRLAGPVGLQHLDDLLIEVSSDRYRPALGTGPAQDQVDAQVWGPYRFTPGVDQASEDGRLVAPLPMQQPTGVLRVGESVRVQMERTRAPHWYAHGESGWCDDFPVDQPVRLRLQCRNGKVGWTVPQEVTAGGWSPVAFWT